MEAQQILKPFVEVSQALCDGVDSQSVMNLIARRLTEALELKGVVVKVYDPERKRLELFSSYGLTEHFLFSKPAPGSVCAAVPPQVVQIKDVRAEDNGDYEAMMVEGIRAAAILPMEVDQEPLGMVVLFSQEPRTLTEEEIQFAKALTSRAFLSLAWERRVHGIIERERHYLQNFQEIAQAINSTLTINKVLKLVVTKITEVMGVLGTSVRLLDNKTNTLYLAQACGLSERFLNKGPVDAQKSIAENMAGHIVVIEDVYTDPRIQYRAEVIEEGIRKILSIPLQVRGKVIGVLRIFTGDREPFHDLEIQYAAAVAQQCAMAIENARMYQRVKYEYQQLLIDFGYEGSSS
ncbi:GAF domain-containing protein [Desulfacinum hydrothermale DSM 13146]|uniref:GAF domain-containing protein n=1 Tax=Desulfacinum hydrothermale DSM 13146 TaxID=1121390 RepID=A0A1W1X028_9BACT|nr:GAF domain-containing protein [Desulfacinum hydrothermale]SMC17332.1 GAF domain-containing protein [Desulfacinum hydrothermale DSM 13146]